MKLDPSGMQVMQEIVIKIAIRVSTNITPGLNGINYGYYCGPKRNGRDKKWDNPFSWGKGPKNEPIDDVDKACQEHDECLANPEDYVNICHHRECNSLFQDDLLDADCSKSPTPKACKTFRDRALVLKVLTTREDRFPLP